MIIIIRNSYFKKLKMKIFTKKFKFSKFQQMNYKLKPKNKNNKVY